MKKDPHYIASLERAITKKYGSVAIRHPDVDWDEETEVQFDRRLKHLRDRFDRPEQQKDEVNGILVSKKLLSRKSRPSCEGCGRYIFSAKDQFYHYSFGACYGCFIEYIEGREERWLDGWRPSKE